jgi:hypothetical protein
MLVLQRLPWYFGREAFYVELIAGATQLSTQGEGAQFGQLGVEQGSQFRELFARPFKTQVNTLEL